MRATMFGCVLVVFALIGCGAQSVAPVQLAAALMLTLDPSTVRMLYRGSRLTAPITFIGGVIGDPDAIAAFFESNLPVAGFSIDYADSEPGESDGIFSKDGQSFRWHLVAQTHCPEVTALQILVNREE